MTCDIESLLRSLSWIRYFCLCCCSSAVRSLRRLQRINEIRSINLHRSTMRPCIRFPVSSSPFIRRHVKAFAFYKLMAYSMFVDEPINRITNVPVYRATEWSRAVVSNPPQDLGGRNWKIVATFRFWGTLSVTIPCMQFQHCLEHVTCGIDASA